MKRRLWGASGQRCKGLVGVVRLVILGVCVLGLAAHIPAAAGAETVFFDDFESGSPSSAWSQNDVGSNIGYLWSVLPQGPNVPVASGNYALGLVQQPYIGEVQWVDAVCGPFNLKGAPSPRLEFDVYCNMPNPSMKLTLHVMTDRRGTITISRIGPFYGATKQWRHEVVRLDRWSSWLWGDPINQNVADAYSPFYLAFRWNTWAPTAPGEGVFIDNVKVCYGTPTVGSISRTPSKSTVSFRRKRGVIRYTLSAMIREANGASIPYAPVVLQTSKNGRSGWKTAYVLSSDENGGVSKTIKATKKSTAYYRWVAGSKRTAKQRIVVK
jgi:hypothetical protein